MYHFQHHKDLMPMCPTFRCSTVLQGTVELIPMCPLFRGFTVRDSRPDPNVSFIQRFHCITRDSRPDPNVSFIQRF